MATRSTIWKQQSDGTYLGIYVHNDGYPEGVGKTLDTYYSEDESKIDALIALGGLSVLDRIPFEPPAGHSFNKPVAGYCVAYARDRREEFFQLKSANLEGMRTEAYNYIWKDGRWLFSDGGVDNLQFLDNLYSP